MAYKTKIKIEHSNGKIEKLNVTTAIAIPIIRTLVEDSRFTVFINDCTEYVTHLSKSYNVFYTANNEIVL